LARKIIETETFVDDLTEEEMGEVGWVLRGRNTGETYHFRSLTNLAQALIEDDDDIFGLSGGYIRSQLKARYVL
jgi:hypothetical protein